MGHTDHERRRLALQAAFLNPLTDGFLRRAGISAGMHVLELGCGIGEVSLIAARLVGPHGRVHCLDFDPKSLEVARGRTQSAGHDHVVFEQADINDHFPSRPYDAVIGRHILLHTPDALALLRKAAAIVHAGGVVAFHEGDFTFILQAIRIRL
jgi:ubiquinone/menaquinone biosynthesis C-methylase UbiE